MNVTSRGNKTSRIRPASSSSSIALIQRDGYEDVVIHQRLDQGLQAVIAIHSTRRGPALGGVRMWPYGSLEEAVNDALRLSKAMSYKAAVSRLPLGGGKAVIIGDPRRDKKRNALLAFGQLVHQLGGRYVTAEDMGMEEADMAVIRQVTPYVAGFSVGQGGSGDPSEMTAVGTLAGIRAVVETLEPEGLTGGSLRGLSFALQGVGKVGQALGEFLFQEGARLIVSDLEPERVRRAEKQWGAQVVAVEDLYGVRCDVFVPCGMGGVLNHRTIPRLRCRAVAGCANNQLAEAMDAERLHRRGILYAPDYVINAGGIINIAVGFRPAGYDRGKAVRQAKRIHRTLQEIFALSEARHCLPVQAADELAETRLRVSRPWRSGDDLKRSRRRHGRRA